MVFRFCSQQTFVTYTKCTYTKEQCLEWFKSKWGLIAYMVSIEKHADGTPHIHAYFKFNRKLDFNSDKCFDMPNGDGVWHPNIVSNVRSPKKCLDYVQKDGDFIATDDIRELIDEGTEDWGSIRKKAKNKHEYMDLVAKNYPRDHALNYERLEYYTNKIFGIVRTAYKTPEGYTFPYLLNEMTSWVNMYIENSENIVRPKSLILVGPTRTGKSMWARSLGEHMYFQGMFNLDEWSNTAKYAVFDDIEWKFFPAKKQFIGCQSDFVLTDRYRKKCTVKYGIPTIVCMNPDNYQIMQKEDIYEWVLGNSIIVIVNKQLY